MGTERYTREAFTRLTTEYDDELTDASREAGVTRSEMLRSAWEDEVNSGRVDELVEQLRREAAEEK